MVKISLCLSHQPPWLHVLLGPSVGRRGRCCPACPQPAASCVVLLLRPGCLGTVWMWEARPQECHGLHHHAHRAEPGQPPHVQSCHCWAVALPPGLRCFVKYLSVLDQFICFCGLTFFHPQSWWAVLQWGLRTPSESESFTQWASGNKSLYGLFIIMFIWWISLDGLEVSWSLSISVWQCI